MGHATKNATKIGMRSNANNHARSIAIRIATTTIATTTIAISDNRSYCCISRTIDWRHVQRRKEAPLVPGRRFRPGVTNGRFGVPDELKDLDVALPYLGTFEGFLRLHWGRGSLRAPPTTILQGSQHIPSPAHNSAPGFSGLRLCFGR